jgi:hypothetical protein
MMNTNMRTDVTVSSTYIKTTLLEVMDELSVAQAAELLDFALFLKSRQTQQRPVDKPTSQPVQRLESLWGDFWPEDESVDDFIATVRQWRREDLILHKDIE